MNNTLALLGNPNSGKTTLFNGLTGSNQHVGNWPGVTVEKKEGFYKFDGEEYKLVDLPGTYSLGAYSDDEIVARDFLLNEKPDLVISVVDATNLERNLYLTTQLLEMDLNVVIALNMMDEARKKNIDIDIKKLSKTLGVPVIPTIASREEGLIDLKTEVDKRAKEKLVRKKSDIYSDEILIKVKELSQDLEKVDFSYPSDWMALKALESDGAVLNMINDSNLDDSIKDKIEKYSQEHELDMIDERYSFIRKIVNDCVSKPDNEVLTLTDKLDKIFTNKYLGIPIFALIMFLVFQLTFAIGEDFLGEMTESFIDFLGDKTYVFLEGVNAPNWFVSLISEGLFNGVGAVIEFVPLIMLLYFFLGILEDTGYMARAAYVMDGVMRSVGLHGKTFIPMIVGFGCNVPGVMATRTLDSKKDRMIAILINPFMSCGAKIPIYLAFTAAFFPDKGGLVLFLLYASGIFVALLMGKIFSSTLFQGEESHFIMELPPYRLPIFKYVVRDMWDKVSSFIKRAGTIIFAVVTLLWLLSRMPFGVTPYSQESLLGIIGTIIAPIFKYAGFGNWQAAVSLLAGIPAKEVVIATLGMVYAGVSEGSELIHAISQNFTPLSAVSFMVMVLLYTPCAAVIATVKQETGSYKWAAFVAIYTFLVGLIASTLVYQLGLMLGF